MLSVLCVLYLSFCSFCLFFFKQKTAYDMRISDWSSDVCSSDLLKACLDYMNAGDTLVVWKLDRLGRSLPHLLAIVTDLKERGIAFRSLTEQMDTTTPHGELLFSLFGALAQYERALTRERIMAGLAAAK